MGQHEPKTWPDAAGQKPLVTRRTGMVVWGGGAVLVLPSARSVRPGATAVAAELVVGGPRG